MREVTRDGTSDKVGTSNLSGRGRVWAVRPPGKGIRGPHWSDLFMEGFLASPRDDGQS